MVVPCRAEIERALRISNPSRGAKLQLLVGEIGLPATAGLDTSEEMLRMMDIPALDAVASGPTPEFLPGARGRGRVRG